ncbi:hypothetical protein ACWGM0_07055 [Sphingomonas bisphenolicum]
MTAKPQYGAFYPSQGGRSASWPGLGYNGDPGDGWTRDVIRLQAEDGGESEGHLFTRGGETTVVCFMHPKGDFAAHYCTPGLAAAGYAVFGQRSRYINHDTGCIHEILIADVAASMRMLRARGFKNIILVGNSGGGSLYTFYQAQAETPVGSRITHTPAGDSYDLNMFDLPPADAVAVLAAHPGEGKALMLVIDPSVTDETDPLSVDDDLDMYNPANGFAPLPAASKYSPEFIQRYREGQRARVARLDSLAREQIRSMRDAKAIMASETFNELAADVRRNIQRRAMASKFLNIYRTDANPANCDLSMDPSPRRTGSLLGPRPDLQNYQLGGVASTMTPEAWLSTWSGLSSHGSVVDNLVKITKPFFIVYFNGDPIVFPEEVAAMLSAASATDKSMVEIDADHYGMDADGTLKPREAAAAELVNWLQQRFPAKGVAA